MADKEKNALDAAATELETLIKSHEPEQKEESIADELVKSAAVESEPEDEPEQKEEPVAKSHTPVSDELRKSLAESDEYQQAYDVSDVIGVLGDAMVKGFAGMDAVNRGTQAQIARLEKNMSLLMRGMAAVLKQQEERSPVRKPMTGHFGGMQKSQAQQPVANDKLPYTAKQLERAADILAEKRQLAPGSLAVIDSRGVESFYKSLGADKQALFAKVIESENIAA